MEQVRQFREWLRGEPDTVLTWWLLTLAAIAIAAALWAPPEVKAGIALWFTAP